MIKFLLALNTVLSVINLIMFTILTGYIVDHTVFDIDKVRSTYMQDMKEWYKRGCVAGTSYPPEFKMPSSYFNPNSPPSWCNDQSKVYEDTFVEQTWKLGR